MAEVDEQAPQERQAVPAAAESDRGLRDPLLVAPEEVPGPGALQGRPDGGPHYEVGDQGENQDRRSHKNSYGNPRLTGASSPPGPRH